MKKIFLLAFGIIAFINLFSQTNIENYIEGRKFKNAESGVVMEYGYIPSLNTKGISYTNQHGKDYIFCSKEISSDGTYMVLTRCIDQQNESVSGIMYFYRTKVIVKEPDSDRRLQFDLVDGNKNITTTKKKTTNSNDDMLSTILSLYQKQVLSDARSINKSSGNLDFGGKKPSNTQSQSNSNLGVCPRCQPYNSKGHRITDFNVSTRLYGNERYIQKPGYIICRSCTGTGLMSQRGPNTCNQCNGERFLKCSYCNGTGKKN